MVEHGASLTIDGAFGPKTLAAVLAFQRSYRPKRLAPNGVIDFMTWAALMDRHAIRVVDVIDATDIAVFEADNPVLNDGQAQVVVNYGMSSGAKQLISDLVRKFAGGSVALLRFHGHGGPGHMEVTGGTSGAHGASFSGMHFKKPEVRDAYKSLGRIMLPYGSIELHGCRVAMSEQGSALLSGLAEACGVPVTAGLQKQTGGLTATRFEGTTRTHFPLGLSLNSWSRSAFSMCFPRA